MKKSNYMMMNNYIKSALLLLIAMMLWNLETNAQYVNVPLTSASFSNDVVANGTNPGNTVSTGSFGSTVTQPAIGIDGVGYTFIDSTYKWYSGSTAPTCFLPTSRNIPSALTSGLTYQLQNYTGFNAMTIASNTYSGSVWPTSDTVSLTTPASYGNLYVLYETVQNTAGPTITATITFTDATTQVISGNTFVNWFTNTNAAYGYLIGPSNPVSRAQNVAPGAANSCTTGPYLFQMTLPISPSNYGKSVQHVSFNFSSATGTTASTVNYLHVLALGGIAPCTSPADQPSALNLSSPSGTTINGTFTAAPSAPSGYLTVVYPSGATPTAPVSGTTYSIGNSIGTGKVAGVGAGTSFGATGLYPGITYDIYVYSYNSGSCAIVYNTTAPLTGTTTTSGVGATLLISPYGDGGFETGNTLALNNWNVINSGTNAWTVGTVPSGFTNRSAYISNNGGGAWAYTNTSVTASHIYKDIAFPAGQSEIVLTFNWKALGESSSWDAIIVYTCPTSVTPVAGQPNATTATTATWTGGAPTAIGSQLWNQGTNLQTFSACLPASFAGTTQRIVITWKNDGSAGTSPPAAVDNIALVSSVPAAPANQATSLVLTPISTSQINGSFTAATSAPAGYVVVRYPSGSTPLTNPVNGTTYIVGSQLGTSPVGTVVSVGASTTFNSTGLSGATSYDYYVYDYSNATCTGIVYNTVAPLSGSQTTNACGTLSGIKPIGPGLPNDTTGGWTSLTNAMAYITANGLGGDLILELQTGYNGTSANETFPVNFPFNPCVNNTKALTIRPASGVTGLVITNTTAAQTLNFNGASYVTIDGRPGGTGGAIAVPNTNYLTIRSTVASAAVSTIQMINDANNITIKYCDLQGQSTTSGALPGTAGGVVFIGNTTGISGNDNNTIDNCNIHSPVNTNTLTMGIYSFGPSGSATVIPTFNENNNITNNNIYDIYGGVNLTTAAIELEKGTNAWTITGNSIFQTINRTPVLTANVVNRGIYVIPTNSTAVGNGFTITGNYIGGMAPQCGGNNYSSVSTGAFNNQFQGMQISVAGGTATNIKSNTINNFNIAQAASTGDLFHAMWVPGAGNINIGGPNASEGNIIGTSTAVAGTTTGITLNSTNAAPAHMIIVPTGGTVATNVLVQNNKIGGITINGNGCPFSGVFCNSSVTLTCDNNLIGSTTIANSINATNAGTTSLVMRGINLPSGSPTATITNNTIANLSNASTSTTSGSQTAGIIVGVSTATVSAITGNTIFNLSCASAGTGGSTSATVEGIGSISTAALACNVSNNTIYNLVSTSASTTAAILMEGIFYTGSTTVTNTVSGNNVHSLNLTAVNPNLSMRGIECNGGTMNVFNNMVRLGINAAGTGITTPVSIYGMLKSSTATQNFYHNSVYIGGSGVTAGTQPSYAYWRINASTLSEDLKNNIFANARSGAGAGKHYAVFIAAGQTANLSINNNIYQATGTNGFFAFNGGSDVSVYSSGWMAGDVNSWNLNPQFNNPTGTAATVDLHINPSVATPVEGLGTSIPLVTLDIDGQTRSGLTPVDIGADAGNFTSLPPCAAPNTPSGVITLTPISTSQIDGSFNPSVPAAELYMVVRHFAGATPVIPVNGTYYSVGNTLGTGTIIAIGTSTTFSATGLFGATAYDFYVYPLNASCTGSTPTYNTLFPFATATTNNCGGISGTRPVGPTAPASPAGFPLLKNALAYLNANGLSGAVVLELQSDYVSTGDTVVIGNIPCLGPLQTLTIRPASGVASPLTITSANTNATIDINGGNFVTIDGRPGGTGTDKFLIVENTSTAAASAGNAILMRNEASTNKVTYTEVRSANANIPTNTAITTAGSIPGAIAIGTTSGANGNDNNIISFCNIHSLTSGGNLGACIYSGNATTAGTAANNDFNTIDNCNIYDFFLAGSASAGIDVSLGNNNWTITNNRIYQQGSRNYAAGTQAVRGLWITPNNGSLTSASGFTITGNYIGGNAANGTGNYTMTGTANYTFRAMDISVGLGTASSIQNNILTNWSITGGFSGNSVFGIDVNAGNVNIGTVTGNVVGSATTNSSITVTTTVTNGSMIALRSGGTGGSVNFSNNTVSGIEMIGNATTVAAGFTGIAGSGALSSTINNNTIGSTTLANSINISALSATSTTATAVRGIICNSAVGGVANTVTNNTVANMSNNYSGTGSGNTMVGIAVATGTSTVTGNTIRNLRSSTNAAGTGSSGAMIGINYTSTTASANVSGNTIYSLGLNGTSTTAAIINAGIFYSGPTTGTNTISKNFIHNLTIGAANNAANINGIDCGGGLSTYHNNMISLGVNDAGADLTQAMVINGIKKATTVANNFYFNTVYIGGSNVSTGASGNNTAAFVRTTSPTATPNDIVRNNIFVNNRSNGSGGTSFHSAIRLNSGITFLTSNNNDFFTSGLDGVLGIISTSTFCSNIAQWRTYSLQDAASYDEEPVFNNPIADAASVDLHIPADPTPTNLESQGVAIAGITTDFDGDTRPGPAGSVNGGAFAPDMGADEFDGGPKAPPIAPPDPTQAAGTPTCAAGTVLTSTGTPPPGVTWYWELTATGTDQSNDASTPLTVYANGTYYIRANNPTTGLWSLGAGSVTVSNFPAGPATPPAPLAAENPANPACGTTLSVAAAPAGVTYYWQTAPTGTSTAQNASSPLAVTVAGTYYVKAKDNTTSCWSNASSITVNFVTPLTGSYNTTQIVSCGGTGSVTIAANGSATVYNNNFSSPAIVPGQSVMGGTGGGVITNGMLVLTPVAAGQNGFIQIFNTTGITSDDFQIDFDFITQGPAGIPFGPTAADGLSYSYGDDVVAGTYQNVANAATNIGYPSNNPIGNTAEGGSGTKLKISFDPWNNGVGTQVGNNGGTNYPGIYFMYNCTDYFNAVHHTDSATAPDHARGVLAFSPASWWRATSTQPALPVNTTHVTIVMTGATSGHLNGTTTLTLAGTTGLATGQSYGPVTVDLPASYLATTNRSNWSHVFAARTGGNWQGHFVDNMSIQYSNIYQYRLVGAVTGPTAWSTSQNFTGLAPDTYTVQIRYQAMPTCITDLGIAVIDAAPTAFTTASTANPVCASTSFTTSISPAPLAGSTFQWESSTDGINFTPIASATAATYVNSTGITVPVYYHCLVTCNGDIDTSSNLLISLNSFIECYCTSNATSTANEDIYNVTLGTLNNSSTCLTTGGAGSILNQYSNYTGVAAPSIQQASPTNFYVEIGTCGGNLTNRTAIFIDYNHDALFTGPGENVYLGSAVTGAHIDSGSITIPLTALTGTTRMRVINVETSGTISPCGTYSAGETEDYFINITPAPPCSGAPEAGTVPASVTICAGTTATFSSTGFTSNVSGVTYQWQESDDNGSADPWTNVTTGTNGFSSLYNTAYTTATLNSSIYYRLIATCTNTSDLDSTSPVFVNVINPQVTSVVDSVRCGTGTVNLHATGSSGSSISWFTNLTGGTPLNTQPYTSVAVTGFNNDIVADSIGSNSVIGITHSFGVDGQSYSFIDNTFKYVSTNALPACFMPANHQAPSLLTPGLTYVFQDYGMGSTLNNNALSLASPATTYTSPLPSSDSLVLVTPASYSTLKVLYESVATNPNSTTPFIVDAVVNFTDNTSQSFTGNSCVNWFTVTNPAFSGMGRTTPAGVIQCGATPNMFELSLALNGTNYNKLVRSITFTLPTILTTATSASNVNYFHAMAVGGVAPAPSGASMFTTPVISDTTIYYVQASYLGCTSSPRTQVVAYVTAAPAIVVTSNDSICQGDTIALSVTSTNDPNYSYTWTPGGFTTPSINVAPNTSTTYNVSAIDNSGGGNNGCVISGSVSVAVTPRPTITTLTSTPAALCIGDSAQINLTAIPFISPSGNYTVTSIPFNPVAGTMPNAGPPAGDETNADATLGFNFNYFGTNYSAVTIHSNGQVIMGAGNTTANSVYTPPAIPSTAAPNNWVGVWADMNSGGSDITWGVVGTAPYRKLVVNFTNVNYWSATPFITFQTVLNETYNTIEVHITSTNGTVGLTRVIGMENSTGTLGTTAPGRSPGLWSASNESWLFAPPVSSSLTYSWIPSATLSNSTVSSPKAGPSATTVYTVTVNETGTGCARTANLTVNVSAFPGPKVYPGDSLICQGSSFYQHVIDTGAYAGGYPAGTTVDWVGIINGLSPDDSVNTSGVSDFQVIVHLPASLGGCNGTSTIKHVTTHTLDVIPSITNSTCGNSNGKIIVNVNGTAPYHYYWSDGSGPVHDLQTSNTSDSITGLTGGFYYLTVIDNEGNINPGLSCSTGQLSYFVPSNGGPVASISAHTDVNCAGNSDGEATATQTGGIGTITYEWFPYGGTAATSTGLGAGDFYVLVTDINGCVDTAEVTITQPDTLKLITGSINASCNDSNGVGFVNVIGGTPPYSYTWYDKGFGSLPGTDDTLTGLAPDTFFVVVVDARGCTDYDTVFVGENPCASFLNLTAFIEGFYAGAGGMQAVLYNAATYTGGTYPNTTDCDTITVELHDPLNTATVIASARAVLQVDGTALVTYPDSIVGGTYYIAVKNRTMVDTWSNLPVSFGTTLTNYNFTTSDTMAYGDPIAGTGNQRQIETGIWVMYSGDIDDGSLSATQDGSIDAFDFLIMDIDIQAGVGGYYVTDLDGSGNTDAFDFLVLDPNIQAGIARLTPP